MKVFVLALALTPCIYTLQKGSTLTSDEWWVRIPPASGQTSRKIQRNTPHFPSKLNRPCLLHRYSRNTWPPNKNIISPYFNEIQVGEWSKLYLSNSNCTRTSATKHVANLKRFKVWKLWCFAITKRKFHVYLLLHKTIYHWRVCQATQALGVGRRFGFTRDLDEVVILCLPARLAKGQCGWGLAGVLAVHPCTLWSWPCDSLVVAHCHQRMA